VVTRTQLRELIVNGESSGVEFKRDEVEAADLAREVVAFANFEGGIILIGVDDDGTVRGVSRPNLEEWVTELCRSHVERPIVPYLSWVRDAEPDRDVLAVEVLDGPDKPYAHVHRGRRTFLIRVGSTNREASYEELQRLFQASGRLAYGTKPVPGATLAELDRARLRSYLIDVLGGEAPDDDDEPQWERLLTNLELMTVEGDRAVPTVDGLLLFGVNPNRFLPQAGVRALAYGGTEPDYAARADEQLRGPLAPLLDRRGRLLDAGLVDQALAFVDRLRPPSAALQGGRRIDQFAYPQDVLREAIVNALVHRDYSIAGVDVTLTLFADRLELVSPGRLPNTITVEGMRAGARYARNQTLVNVMRDYGYVDFRGMGVRTKMIPGMRAYNGTEPLLAEEERGFVVQLLAGSPV